MLQKAAGLNQRPWLAFGLLAMAVKLVLATTTFGTNDVATWHRFADSIAAHGALWLYHADPLFNHPPFMTRALMLLRWLADHTGLGFPFWIRFPAILADFGSLWLTALIIGPKTKLLILLAICPISILVSGFHGNTDPVMVFLLLLAIYLIENRNWLLLGAVVFGLAACIKVAAFALVPAFLFYLPTNRRRAIFASLMGATFVLLSLPFLLQDPVVIVRNVFGYGGLLGIWGFPRIEQLIAHMTNNAGHIAGVARLGRLTMICAITALMLFLPRRSVSLYGRCALSAFLLLWSIPGFGVQYLSWLVPFTLYFGESWTIAVYSSSGLFLFLAYNYWSQSFPWYFADAITLGIWPAAVIPFELLAWFVIGLTFCAGIWRCWKDGSFINFRSNRSPGGRDGLSVR